MADNFRRACHASITQLSTSPSSNHRQHFLTLPPLTLPLNQSVSFIRSRIAIAFYSPLITRRVCVSHEKYGSGDCQETWQTGHTWVPIPPPLQGACELRSLASLIAMFKILSFGRMFVSVNLLTFGRKFFSTPAGYKPPPEPKSTKKQDKEDVEMSILTSAKMTDYSGCKR